MFYDFHPSSTKQQRETIIESLRGSYPKLLQSKVAATIVELIYNDYATPAQRFIILSEVSSEKYKQFQRSEPV